MTAGTSCDNCRAFGPQRAPGWFFLAQQPGTEDPEPSSFIAALFGNPSEPLTFCTVKCLAEWAYVQKLAAEAAAGTGPG